MKRHPDNLDAPPGETSDAELVANILAASTREERDDAYRVLLDRYWHVIVALLRSRLSVSKDVEDIAQEAFIRVWKALPRLANPNLFLGWLIRIAQNLATDYLRKWHRETPMERVEDAEFAFAQGWKRPPPGVAEQLERQEQLDQVLAALHRLPEPYQVVVTLRYLREMSSQEMARCLGEPEGTVRNRIFRALGKIRKILETEKVQKR